VSGALIAAAIAGLLLLNALYVAAEFAVVAARRHVLDLRAARGDRAAARVARVVGDTTRKDRYIAAAQLGITVASLGLGMYAESRLAGWIAARLAGAELPVWLASHALASAIAIVGLTYLHIVLGEMVPKSIALARAEESATRLAPLMRATSLVAYPLIRLLGSAGDAIMNKLGLPRRGAPPGPGLAELHRIVKESEASGQLGPEAAEVLEELFEFGARTAAEVMVPRVRVRGVELGSPMAEIEAIIRDGPHTRYPVFAGDLDHVVGTIHIKDVLRRSMQGDSLRQADLHPVPFVPETSALDKVLAAMRQSRTHMAVVMDEHGGTAGIVTVEDVFEEVVGEIEDVASGERPSIHRAPDGTLRAAGTARVDEVGEALDLPLEHAEVDTVSGLVLALLDRPPRVGDAVTYQAVRFEVTAVAGHGVAQCRVTPGPDTGLDGESR
jgi:CBS domain containing-hemolysin-like protein